MSPVELRLPRPGGMVREYKRIPIRQVDAFTEIPLTGNSAGVVVNAAGLSTEQMQTIAREMNVSETAFIFPPSTPSADLRIRWFSPTTEVSLCGHATVAAFHALAEEGMHGMKDLGVYQFNVETKSGVLPVGVEKTTSGIDISFGLRLPEFERAGQFKLDLMRILNIQLEEFESRLPIVTAEHLYVPVRRLHTIFAMKPNFYVLAQFLANKNLTGLCVFTTETVERKSHVHSRFFAPNIGIDEDPVTGSTNGPLGVYLFEQGLLAMPVAGNPPERGQSETLSLIGEQGDVIGRKGRVSIVIDVKGTQVVAVRIGGRAVTVLDGEMVIV